MVTKTCKFCNQTTDYENVARFAGHVTMCLSNPNRLVGIKKQLETWASKNPIKQYSIMCKKCNNTFTLTLKEKTYLSGVYANHCSRKCSNSRIHSIETKQKIGEALKKKAMPNFCKCGTHIPKKRNFCKLCKPKITDEYRKTLSDRAKKIGLGGNRSRSAVGWYESPIAGKVFLESSWELSVAKSLDENNIEWNRPSSILWIDSDGKSHKYYADFYLPTHSIYLDPKNPYLQICDADKLKRVEHQNSIRILMLSKNELTWDIIRDKIMSLESDSN